MHVSDPFGQAKNPHKKKTSPYILYSSQRILILTPQLPRHTHSQSSSPYLTTYATMQQCPQSNLVSPPLWAGNGHCAGSPFLVRLCCNYAQPPPWHAKGEGTAGGVELLPFSGVAVSLESSKLSSLQFEIYLDCWGLKN